MIAVNTTIYAQRLVAGQEFIWPTGERQTVRRVERTDSGRIAVDLEPAAGLPPFYIFHPFDLVAI